MNTVNTANCSRVLSEGTQSLCLLIGGYLLFCAVFHFTTHAEIGGLKESDADIRLYRKYK
jgi:hypothetical protein